MCCVRINAASKAGCQHPVPRRTGDPADVAIGGVIFANPYIAAAPVCAATNGHPYLKIWRAHHIGRLKQHRGIHRAAGDVVAGRISSSASMRVMRRLAYTIRHFFCCNCQQAIVIFFNRNDAHRCKTQAKRNVGQAHHIHWFKQAIFPRQDKCVGIAHIQFTLQECLGNLLCNRRHTYLMQRHRGHGAKPVSLDIRHIGNGGRFDVVVVISIQIFNLN